VVTERDGKNRAPALYHEYWLVETPWNTYTVSSTIAAMLRRELNRWPRPAWVSLIELSGARVLVRTKVIMAMEQSSAETRDMWRKFREERKQENPLDL
jgi:hypothetical protein